MVKVIEERTQYCPYGENPLLKSEENICHVGARLPQKEFVLPQGSIFKLTEIRRK